MMVFSRRWRPFPIWGVVVLCLVPTVRVTADSPWLYGIHWYGDPASNDLETMTGSKGIWTLETVLTEDTGQWSLAAQLNKLQTAAARGHTIIVRIQPRWSLVVPGPNDAGSTGDRMSTFIPKVISVAQQLADVCHIWQIGNEMNLGFEYDIGDLTPALYVQKYNEIRTAIQSVPSSLGPQIVLVGPVAPVDTGWLGSMCDAINAGPYPVDGFAMHAYGGSRTSFINDIKVQADLISAKGFAAKPIYVTEWGAKVDPISDTVEAGVAQFLHGALSDLAVYNANPANHDIVCACWFVYAYDAYWKNWSILYLRDLHPRGANSDLYDAYQYACTLNLPAGEDFGSGSGTQPAIARSPVSLSPSCLQGQNAASGSFTVHNSGVDTLHYTISGDMAWLSVSPTAGDSAGETDTITVNYTTAGLSVGQYAGTITIADAQAANSPQTIAVTLNVQSQVVTPTITNPDFEADGGFFTVATGWTAFGGNKWERILDASRASVQGVTDIPVNNGVCGVHQKIDVTPGAQYRVAVYGKTHTADLDVAIGVDPGGGTNHASATFGTVSNATAWTQVTADFTATGTQATIFLRGRNPKSWFVSGNWCMFDGVTIEVIGSSNQPPTAVVTADPTSGDAPLTVSFSGSGSSDPDGHALTYAWDFGDGQQGSGVSLSHTYTSAGTYSAVLTVDDGHGGSDTDNVTIQVGGGVSGENLVVNPSFEGSFAGGVAESWQSWSAGGTGYWKQSSRLGRIGAGMYNGSGGYSAAVRLNPKVVLLHDSALGHSAAIRAALPDALIIGRLYIDNLVSTYLGNPEYYGRVHADNCYSTHLQKPGIDAWQGMNEPYLNDESNARLAGRFEKAFAERCHELGLKACVMNIAVGNPGDMDTMLLPEIVGALAVGDYVGYHSYGGIQNQLMIDPPGGASEQPWFSLRWRFYIDMYAQHGYRMPPVVYTECTTFYAWHGEFTAVQIRDDLNAFEAETKSDPWSAGMAIFLVGSHSSQWDGWEVADQPTIYEGCGDYNLAHPADAWDGIASQQFGQTGTGGFSGGLVQQVTVEAGRTYEVASWMKCETYGVGTDMAYQVGYDLTGQTNDPDAGSIVWTADLIDAESRETDWWYAHTRQFVATGPNVSLWFRASQAAGKPAFRVSLDEVSLRMLDVPPAKTADFDGDSDADQSDFALLQRCLTGENVAVTDPTCTAADLDDDDDVDMADFATFQACYAGPNQPMACP